MKQKATIFIFIIAFIVLAGLGYSLFPRSNSQNTRTPGYTGVVEKIRVGNIGEYSIFNPIAHEKGYFQQNGLNANIIEYESGPKSVAALLAGEVDVAVAADFVGVRNIFANNHLRILAQASKHKVFYMLGRVDHGIQNPSTLKGKKIGVTKKGAGEFYLGRFLIYNHLGPKDLTIVDLTPPEMTTQLENSQIDAIVIFDPHAYNLKKKLGDSVVSWSVQSNQNTFALVYTTDTFIATHQQAIERYMRSLIQAEQFSRKHSQETQDYIAKILRYDPQYVRYIWSNFTFAHGLDQELLLTMEDQARFAINNGLTDQKEVPNYLNYIYFNALEKVQPESVTIIH